MHGRFSGFWSYGCTGRHGRHRGFAGLFGAGERGAGWHGLGGGRKLSSEDLQLLILALLADKPAHGYEIIKDIGERSGGFYSPSPGMVYPALTYLEEIGYARAEAEGTRKRYEITDTGRAYVERNRRLADTLLGQLKWMGEKMQHVRRAFAGDDGGWGEELVRARNALREVLGDTLHASPEEQRRIADILERAAREIRRD
jgi:DNA-binding PadR family transcriptional regulator